MPVVEFMVLLVLATIVVLLQLLLLLRRSSDPQAQAELRTELRNDLHAELNGSAQTTRQEIANNFAHFQQAMATQMTSVATVQNNQIDSFAQQLVQLNQSNREQLEAIRNVISTQGRTAREEQAASLARFGETLSQSLNTLTESNAQRMTEVRATLETKIGDLQQDNGKRLEEMRNVISTQTHAAREEQAASLARFGENLSQSLNTLTESNAQRMTEVRATLEAKIGDLQQDNGKRLEEMRKTVDEKLHATLEQRLGESFKLVSDRLEKVHQGLGEMQQLALGVGDLKRVLTNVKTRGTWGEVQLGMLLEQLLTIDQYGKNVETIPGSGARVEFAIKLPGSGDAQHPVWMPIDAKFPKEQYERLCLAAEAADADGVLVAGRELENAVRLQAKTISKKYLSPPLTTDFAILFLPTEGLYAEVMRRPGLADEMQREYRISIAGPSTLSALLNSLQMGFRTLALEKRSSEVWQVLGAVKTEFGKFGDVLAATKLTLERAAKNIESAEVRSRQMTKKLKSVEALPSETAQQLLGTMSDADADNNDADAVGAAD